MYCYFKIRQNSNKSHRIVGILGNLAHFMKFTLIKSIQNLFIQLLLANSFNLIYWLLWFGDKMESWIKIFCAPRPEEGSPHKMWNFSLSARVPTVHPRDSHSWMTPKWKYKEKQRVHSLHTGPPSATGLLERFIRNMPEAVGCENSH